MRLDFNRPGKRAAGLPSFHKILYRSVGLAAMGLITVIAGGCFAIPSAAQESTPEIVPLKKELRKKKDLGPRAVGLLKMTPSGKATLVPIMIEIEGKFYDASAYKADPVPMAVESGTVYEGQKTGSPLGLFTINSALHSLAANADVPWIATGAWLAGGAEAPKTAMKAEIVPKGIEDKDAPPRLSKGDAANGAPATATPPPTTSPTAAPSTTSAPPPASPPSAAPSAPGSPAPAASNPSATTPGSTAPPAASTGKAERKKDENKAEQKKEDASSSVQDTTFDDTNRPRLRRGKPTGPMPDYEVPGYGKLQSAKDSGVGGGSDAVATPIASAVPMEQVELIPAISDADGPEPRSFAYEWDKGTEEERRREMLDLAKQQLRAYIDARAKGQIPAKPAAPKKTVHKTATKTPEPILENVQMRTFDLWGSNQPVLILSADAHLPLPASGAASDLPAAPLQYKIVLVTRTDIYNDLHKLYSGVTDRFHLDVAPQLELIDAVDADGDGSGELLFRKTTDTGRGYVIYRATADSLWKMFDNVSPE